MESPTFGPLHVSRVQQLVERVPVQFGDFNEDFENISDFFQNGGRVAELSEVQQLLRLTWLRARHDMPCRRASSRQLRVRTR
ncbi:MAG: hypothetical protein ORN51_07090 [Akkermansiaceae bacterium]|nr:hypothetical protein [Akkermansiaceae bacterium]